MYAPVQLLENRLRLVFDEDENGAEYVERSRLASEATGTRQACNRGASAGDGPLYRSPNPSHRNCVVLVWHLWEYSAVLVL